MRSGLRESNTVYDQFEEEVTNYNATRKSTTVKKSKISTTKFYGCGYKIDCRTVTKRANKETEIKAKAQVVKRTTDDVDTTVLVKTTNDSQISLKDWLKLEF